MSLVSLRKSAPLINRQSPVSVDEFIEDAINYAAGVSNATVSRIEPAGQSQAESKIQEHLLMRRATFTLSEECIEQLGQISRLTGHAKSYLLRCWINEKYNHQVRG